MTNPGQPAAPSGEARTQGRSIGRYLILDEIASGGMATVHLAHARAGLPKVGEATDADHDRFVAVKCMHAHYARDPDFVSMFLDEAMLCTHIRHENVVATIDVSQEHDELLLVLELVEGESLSKLVKSVTSRKARVPQPIVSAIVCDMLKGLHAAHEATNASGEALMIVHRDVSPHNVLVGTDGIAKVLDFGVAKARGRVQQTQKGQLKGKLAYMSPEQARGKMVDRRSDVFAAGIVLWELLVGGRLFDGENEAALLIALLSEEPSPPGQKDAELVRFDELVLKALSTDPEKRFPTGLAFAAAIESAIPPASREEVGAWVKAEARSALLRRDELIQRARRQVAALRNPNAARERDSSPTAIASDVLEDRPATSDPPLSLDDDDGWEIASAPPPAASDPPRASAEPAAVDADAKGPEEPPARDESPRTSADAEEKSAVSSAGIAPTDTEPAIEAPAAGTLPRPVLPRAPLPPRRPITQAAKAEGAEAELASPAPAAVGPTPPIESQPLMSSPPEPALWDSSTTTDDEPKTVAIPPEANKWNIPSEPPTRAMHHHDLTVPLFRAPFDVSGDRPVPQRVSSPPTAEGIPSQVTSVTLTTTDMPPPMPKEHVRRLTWVAAGSAAVGAIAATVFLIMMTGSSHEEAAARRAVETEVQRQHGGDTAPSTTQATPTIATVTPVPSSDVAQVATEVAATSASASASVSTTAVVTAPVPPQPTSPPAPRPTTTSQTFGPKPAPPPPKPTGTVRPLPQPTTPKPKR